MAPAQEVSVLAFLLQGLLPEDWLVFLNEHVLAPHSPVQIAKRNALVFLQQAVHRIYPLVKPVLDSALTFLAANPALVSFAQLALFLAIVVLMVNWVHRILMFWTKLAFSVVLYAACGMLAMVVYQRGVYASLRDLVVLCGQLLGFLAGVKDHWVSEYRRYEADGRMGR